MKIGIVSEFHYPTIGGIQEHVHHSHRELLRLGYDVTVFTSTVRDSQFPKGEEVADPGKVRHIGTSRVFPANGSASRVSTGRKLAEKFRRALAEEKCDLLHIHTPFAPTLPMLALKEAEVPVVGTFHTNIKQHGDGFIKRFLPFMSEYLKRLDARIAVSHTSARTMRQCFGGRYEVIPNGVDVEGFSQGRPRPEYADGRLNLLFVGRLDPRNGLDELLHAAGRAARHVPLRVLIMGDGSHRAKYEALARELLGPHAVFLGTRIASRPDWYATADIMCAPMHVASFGLVLTEGMAAGLPILANRIAGFSDVMQDGREGIFVDTKDIDSFAEAIQRLGQDELLRRRLAKCGSARVQQYSWQNVMRSVTRVYEKVLPRPARHATDKR